MLRHCASPPLLCTVWHISLAHLTLCTSHLHHTPHTASCPGKHEEPGARRRKRAIFRDDGRALPFSRDSMTGVCAAQRNSRNSGSAPPASSLRSSAVRAAISIATYRRAQICAARSFVKRLLRCCCCAAHSARRYIRGRYHKNNGGDRIIALMVGSGMAPSRALASKRRGGVAGHGRWRHNGGERAEKTAGVLGSGCNNRAVHICSRVTRRTLVNIAPARACCHLLLVEECVNC